LTVNGSLIARQVNLFRTNGDISSAASGEASNSPNIAETINYTPAMLVGGPFFNPPPTKTLDIESLVNLPPLF
jgi:hypothetical protein